MGIVINFPKKRRDYVPGRKHSCRADYLLLSALYHGLVMDDQEAMRSLLLVALESPIKKVMFVDDEQSELIKRTYLGELNRMLQIQAKEKS